MGSGRSEAAPKEQCRWCLCNCAVDTRIQKKKTHCVLRRLIEHASLDTTAALNYSVDLDSANNKDHPLMKCLGALFSNMAGWKGVMMCK